MGVIRSPWVETVLRTPRVARCLLRLAVAAVAAVVGAVACRGDLRPPPIGSPRETMSDIDHGATAAAVDAMDQLTADAEPDTEVHLRLSVARSATADDSTRGDLLLVAMRGALRKYADVRVAAADGFEEMPATAGKHAVHHLSNWAWARAEARRFDPAKPTSLLYRESADGTLQLVGAMYTAPASATPAELDQRIPVGLARWHQHINWCAPKAESGLRWLATQDGSPLYGPRSPIATREACDAAGGVFYPRVFGWMVHVTVVGSDDPSVVWGGGSVPPSSPPDSGARPDSTTAAVTPPSAWPSASPSASPSVSTTASTSASPPPATTPTLRNRLAARLTAGAATRLRAATTVTPAAPPATPPAVTPATAPAVATAPATTAPIPAPTRTVFATATATTGTYQSGGAPVAYERYEPAGAGRHPAVLLLPDAVPAAQANEFHALAAALTRRGYVAEVVHYLDRTSTDSVTPDQRRAHFRQWAGAVNDALTDVARDLAVDGGQLGVLGEGLGATLALTVSVQEPRIKAVADYAGALPARAAPFVQRMPPVFIAHGDQDKVVPIAEAYRIRSICQGVKAPVELDVLYGQGHAVQGAGAEDRRHKTLAFFDRYLKSAH
jgi:dienelactone hydrolase